MFGFLEKNRKIKQNFQGEIEPQEIFLDISSYEMEEKLGVPEKKFEVPLSKRIFRRFLIFSLILILVLFFRTIYLQIFQGELLSLLAQENRIRILFQRAERGVIYDKNFKQIVLNIPSFDLLLDKRDLPTDKQAEILESLAKIIGKDFDQFQKEIEDSSSQTILVLENIDHETLLLLESKVDGWPGVWIEKSTVRDYPEGQVLSHLLGFAGKINKDELETLSDYSISDYIGKDGLEKYYEEILRGEPGKIKIEKDVLANVRSRSLIQEPKPGKSLLLYLDSEFQEKAFEILNSYYRRVGARGAVAVAISPKTGGILGLVSLPSFDNNLFSTGISQENFEKLVNNPKNPLFNRAIAGEYLPGSTIKPLIASAALEEKTISSDKQLNCQGEITLQDPYNPDIVWRFKDWKIHGWTDMRKAIADSVNVYFYTIGGGYHDIEGLGVDRIKKYLNMFGWGKILGIDLPGETTGLVPDRVWKTNHFETELDKSWYTGDTYNLSIGQGFLKITPLQVATSFAAIANGGRLLVPQVVHKIVDDQRNVVQEIEPEILAEGFIDSENLEVIREGMRGAATTGTASYLADLPVKAAAKTGSAQVGGNLYNLWLTIFAPYEDPEIVLTVVFENVDGINRQAFYAAKEILQFYFSRQSPIEEISK